MADKIRFKCSNCGKAVSVDSVHAGKKAPCPGCKTILTIPAAPVQQQIPQQKPRPRKGKKLLLAAIALWITSLALLGIALVFAGKAGEVFFVLAGAAILAAAMLFVVGFLVEITRCLKKAYNTSAERRKRQIRISAIILCTALMLSFGIYGLCLWLGPVDDNNQQGYLCKVVRIVDGDTIVVDWDGKQEKIRMLHINVDDDDPEAQNRGRILLESLIGNKTVRLVMEKDGVMERGRYGRILAYVFCDGKNINTEMVRLGCCTYWIKYGRSRFEKKFLSAQEEAIKARMGIWDSEVVYVTKTDKLYHKEKCWRLHGRGLPMPLNQAKLHHKPCPFCRPPE